MPLNVLVTGANGFLGAHLVRRLLQGGHTVVCGVREDSDIQRLDALTKGLPPTPRLHLCLAEPDSRLWAAALQEQDIAQVVHCAAYGVDARQQDPDLAYLINVIGSQRLVEAASLAGVARFIHVGTCYEYGDHPQPVDENTKPDPQGPYGTTKAKATQQVLSTSKQNALPLAVVRPFGLFGPLEGDHKLIPMVIQALKQNRHLALTSGEQIRDYCYVGDVCDWIIDLLTLPHFPQAEIVNLGSGKPITIRELVESVARVMNAPTGLLGWGERPQRPGGIASIYADCSKLDRLLPESGFADLDCGISKTLEWS